MFSKDFASGRMRLWLNCWKWVLLWQWQPHLYKHSFVPQNQFSIARVCRWVFKSSQMLIGIHWINRRWVNCLQLQKYRTHLSRGRSSCHILVLDLLFIAKHLPKPFLCCVLKRYTAGSSKPFASIFDTLSSYLALLLNGLTHENENILRP